MAGNRRPRKAYRPYRAEEPIPEDAHDKISMPPHVELMKLERGAGDETSYHTLASFLNVGFLATRRLPNFHAEVIEGLSALKSMWDRHTRLGRWGVSGEELSSLRLAVTRTETLFRGMSRDRLLSYWDRAVKLSEKIARPQ